MSRASSPTRGRSAAGQSRWSRRQVRWCATGRRAGTGLASTVPAPTLRCRHWTCSGSEVTSSSSRRLEEHTSELQSRQYLVCRLLLEKKKKELLDDKLVVYAETHILSSTMQD